MSHIESLPGYLQSNCGLLAPEQLRVLLLRALRLSSLPQELLLILQQQPTCSADLLAECVAHCEHRRERERLVELAAGLGVAGISRLEQRLLQGTAGEAVKAVGLLARLAPGVLEQHLLPRLVRWDHARQDEAVKAIVFSGAAVGARLLLRWVEHVHAFVLPGLVEGLGSLGDAASVPWLLRLAAGEAFQAAEPYIRVKAIEALGQMRVKSAVPLLVNLIEARQMWHWLHPRELRVCALQALERIDPTRARKVQERAGLPARELALAPLEPPPDAVRIRQRRYLRVRLPRALPMTLSWRRGTTAYAAEVFSLGGGFACLLSRPPSWSWPETWLAHREEKPAPGSVAEVAIQVGWRRLGATVVVRNQMLNAIGFEFVAMGLEARSRLRHLLTALQP